MLHHVNPHAVHAVLADNVVVVVGEGWVGGQHGGWHVGWEARTVGGWHILLRGERAGQVGEWVGGRQVGEWRGWAHGHLAWFGVQERRGWALWGHVGLHRCDTGMKYWEVRIRPSSGGQALVAQPGEAVTHPPAHILVTVH